MIMYPRKCPPPQEEIILLQQKINELNISHLITQGRL